MERRSERSEQIEGRIILNHLKWRWDSTRNIPILKPKISKKGRIFVHQKLCLFYNWQLRKRHHVGIQTNIRTFLFCQRKNKINHTKTASKYRASKKSSLSVTGLWNRGPPKILNGIKLILDDQWNRLDSYTISLESFRSFRAPLFRKPVTDQELFLLFLTANRL